MSIYSWDVSGVTRASLYVKTASDVVKPCVVSGILTLTGVHGHLTAALLAEMQDFRGSANFENCGTEFWCSRCIRQGGLEASCVVGTHRLIHGLESRTEVASQRLAIIFRRIARP